jgi:hypothetical protein
MEYGQQKSQNKSNGTRFGFVEGGTFTMGVEDDVMHD